jgi:L-ascorbate metabolism protein UlaG (beta-lactamase superfamily)
MNQENNTGATVEICWLGTSGIFVTDGKTGILIDPYVSRFGIFKILVRLPLVSNRSLIRDWVAKLGRDNISAVLVSHSHFDHVIDAPYFAMDAGAPLIGTVSTLNVGRGAGMPTDKLVSVKPGQTLKCGDFTIKFLESEHSLVGGRIPYPGVIDRPVVPPANAAEYKLGGVYSFLLNHPSGTILHHGSAGFKPGMYDDIQTDVILLGIASRGDTDAYLENVVLKTRARLVVPVHMDNFFKPLQDDVPHLPSLNYKEFLQKAGKYGSVFKVLKIPLCRQISILPLHD